MPKEKTSTRAMTGPRILNISIPTYNNSRTATGWPESNGWNQVGVVSPGANGVYYESYFDLSAYELDDLTLVPNLLQLQDGLPYFGSLVEGMDVYDIISQERLVPNDFINYALAGDYPSSPGSKDDWSQILMCNTRFMAPNTQWAFADLFLPATRGDFGSAEPTAVQKLWVYRIVLFRGADEGSTMNIPATRFVVGADIVQEKELPYMMRLKRSYELTNQG